MKGNVIDPLDVIEQHGADALRFALAWLTTSAAQGKNIKFSMSNVEDSRRFANKIWNATRFALMNLDGYDPDRFADRIADGPDRAELDLPERWILSRVQRVSEEVDAALEEYRIADAAQAVYHFVWGELCDWYIELAKAGFQRAGTDVEARSKIQGALVTALETAMRLLHPFMPFLTEEIWQQLPKPSGAPQSIMITLYPVRDVRFHDDASEASMALVQKIIVAVRSIRTERNIPTSARADRAAGGHRRLQEDDPRRLQDDHRRAGALQRGARPPQRRQLLGRVRAQQDGDGDGGRRRGDGAARGAGRHEGGARQASEGQAEAREGHRDYLKRKLADTNYTSRAPLEVLDKDKAKLAEARGGAGQDRRSRSNRLK